MFDFLKKDFKVTSPVDGETFDLAEFPDPVFAEKITGDGTALRITGDTFVAPADGKIGFIFDTNHAFGMILENGIELLVHIGVDTVKLNGEGFTRLAEPDQYVKCGTPIIKIDKPFLESKGYCLSTPVLITNMDAVKSFTQISNNTAVKAGSSTVITYKTK